MTHDGVHKAHVLASIKREETKQQSRDNKPRQVRYRRYQDGIALTPIVLVEGGSDASNASLSCDRRP
jgi:hypothetical protein